MTLQGAGASLNAQLFSSVEEYHSDQWCNSILVV